MTCFKPFRALRPRADLAQLALCPPYDVVTRREAEEIAAKSPFSFMHVIRAEADLPGEDPYSEAVYRRGAANLKKLEKAKGAVLIETIGKTMYTEILQELQLLDRQQIKVLGGIMVEE